jgi:branched-chain amino acid transport system ATP-binding protein
VKEECLEVIEMIGLTECINIPAGELSYGDQRTLEIGISLSTEPEILLLDEPTAGMSGEETWQAVEFIKRVTNGRTLVIVEHDMEVVFALTDRIMVLSYGGILVTDIPERIRSNEKVRKIYFGEENITAGVDG